MNFILLQAHIQSRLPQSVVKVYESEEAYRASLNPSALREKSEHWCRAWATEEEIAADVYKIVLRGGTAWDLPAEAGDIPPSDLFFILEESPHRDCRCYRLESTRFPYRH